MIDLLQQNIRTAPRPELDRLAREVWALYGAGRLTDHEAQALADAIENRRRAPQKPLGRGRAPMRPRSTEYRSGLAHTLFAPPHIKARFTISELAVLRIIADEFSNHGLCDRTIGELAARASVGRTTVQNTVRRARQMGLITVEERRVSYDRSLSNVIRIVSPEWVTFLRLRQRRARPEGSGFNSLNSLRTKEYKDSESSVRTMEKDKEARVTGTRFGAPRL